MQFSQNQTVYSAAFFKMSNKQGMTLPIGNMQIMHCTAAFKICTEIPARPEISCPALYQDERKFSKKKKDTCMHPQ